MLYTGISAGRLQPAPAGLTYQLYESEVTGIAEKHLFAEHPYFRLLHELGSILFDESTYRANRDLVKLVVRGYVDERYLRLSISGIMPDVTPSMMSMPFRRRDGRATTPRPRVGRFGILDQDDLRAWKKLSRPLREMGYVLLGQLGAGEFGRVYDALNLANPTHPPRVAVKIDRIVRRGPQKRIQDATTVMQIGRDLASSPHIIRLYDAGQLSGRGYTYHVLQRIDGDTLDNLLSMTGHEHSSVSSTRRPWSSEAELRTAYARSVGRSRSEVWRRMRIALPFQEPPTLLQAADLVTSVLLWVEKVHQLGYVVNDLKNGNLMVSRRGQLKGIDLDAYSPQCSPLDKMQDFLFLSSSLLLLQLYLSGVRSTSAAAIETTLRSRDDTREAIQAHWRFGNLADLTEGRVRTGEFIDVQLNLLHGCRSPAYIEEPECFTRDIDRFIRLKRLLSTEDMVLD